MSFTPSSCRDFIQDCFPGLTSLLSWPRDSDKNNIPLIAQPRTIGHRIVILRVYFLRNFIWIKRLKPLMNLVTNLPGWQRVIRFPFYFEDDSEKRLIQSIKSFPKLMQVALT